MFRKFEEALPNHPEAQLALDWIGQLYAIDERAGPDLELKAKLRKTEAIAVLAELKVWHTVHRQGCRVRHRELGAKSRSGTQVAATLYTLVETAKLQHVAPTRYLLEAVRAADRGEVLLPWQLAADVPDTIVPWPA